MAYLYNYTVTRPSTIKYFSKKNSKSINYGQYLVLSFIVIELIIINLSFLLTAYLKPEDIITFSSRSLIFGLIYNTSWIIISSLLNRIKVGRSLLIFEEIKKSLALVIIHFLLISAIFQFFNHFNLQDGYILANYSILLFLVIITRSTLILTLKKYRRSGYNYKNVIIVGNGRMSWELHKLILSNPSFGYKYHGVFSEKDEYSLDVNYVGEVSSVFDYCVKNNINEIFCTIPLSKKNLINELMQFADNNLIRFRIIPDLGEFSNRNVEIGFMDKLPIITTRKEPLEKTINRITKRTFDIFFSILIILFLFPFIFPVLALLIRLSSRGPILFKQLRSGKNNSHFYCYKFRTMKVNQESDKMQAEKNDTRITKVGKLMRKTNLDELPQFFNVLKGEMSVVGPRPHMIYHTKQYSKIINKYMVRHFVKPGITGWAQVNGYRGNTENNYLMEKRVEYDMWYLENWNLILDIKIVLLTVFNTFKGEKNAY